MRTGREHDLTMLAPFGCLATVHIKPKDRNGKLRPAAAIGIYLGHGERSDGGIQGYRVFKPSTNRIVVKHDVDLLPDIPAMQHIARMASTSVQSQFLHRDVTAVINSHPRSGTVRGFHTNDNGTYCWSCCYPHAATTTTDGRVTHTDLWVEYDFDQLLQHIVPTIEHTHARIPSKLRTGNRPHPPRSKSRNLSPDTSEPAPPVSASSTTYDFTGRTIRKRFGSKFYHGIVQHPCKDNPGKWRVHYQADNTWEPLTPSEIGPLLTKDTTSDQTARTRTRRPPVRLTAKAPGGLTSDTQLSREPPQTRMANSHAAMAASTTMMPLPPKRTIDATTKALDIPEPKNSTEASRSPYRDYFRAAELKETRSLIDKGTWTIETPGYDVTTIKSAFVYKIKELHGGLVDKVKARFCAKGYSQIPGIHYKTKFAPVASATAIRIIMYLACQNQWPLHHLDVSTAFLNADIEPDVELFITPPHTLALKPGEKLRLRKGLYGLAQGGARWYQLVSRTLIKLGFTRTASDPCVFFRTTALGTVYTSLVVDDFCMTGSTLTAVTKFKNQLMKIWDCTDLGSLDWFIKIHLTRNQRKGTMRLSQRTYIEGMIKRYMKGRFTPIDTPMAPNTKLSNKMCPVTIPQQNEASTLPFRELLGSLQYCRLTRPDVLQAISSVAKFTSNHGKPHYQAAIRILRYLATTSNHALEWTRTDHPPGSPLELRAHVDSDWANDQDHRRSRTGYVISINENPISFATALQPKTASSTAVAEYIALASAVKELIHIKQLLQELGFSIALPMNMEEDNTTCIHIATNPTSPRKTRHIDIRYHFLRDYISNGSIRVRYIPSALQLADILTKPLPRPAFIRIRRLLRVKEPD